MQSSPDLRILGTIRSWRGVEDFAIAFLSSTFGVLKPGSAGFEGRSLVKLELRPVPWFAAPLPSLMEDSGVFKQRLQSGLQGTTGESAKPRVGAVFGISLL